MGASKCSVYGSHNISETIPLKSSQSQKELLKKQQELKKKAEFLKSIVIWASVISIFLNLIMAIAAFVIAAMRDSAATYAFGADCLLDLISSAILLWRFFGNEDHEATEKERKACITLGILFVTSAIAVICKASVDIVQMDKPVTFHALYILAVFGTTTCFLMAIIKIVLAKLVNSASLMLDAVNSVISGMLALVIILSDTVYHMNNDIWYLEPTMSIILSALLVLYGIKVIVDNSGSPKSKSTSIGLP